MRARLFALSTGGMFAYCTGTNITTTNSRYNNKSNFVDCEEESKVSDVIIIGGGIVGLAVAREFAVREKSVTLLEKDDAIISGSSSGNSGIGCTGYDAPTDSLERLLLRRSILKHPNLYRSLGLSYDHVRKCGALVVAWDHEELSELPKVLKENINAGDYESKILNRDELFEIEPSLNKNALGAVFANREMVTEPWLVPVAYAYNAMLHGAKIFVNKEVVKADFKLNNKNQTTDNNNGIWTIRTNDNEMYKARHVINCAGINGDKIHNELIRNNNINFLYPHDQMNEFTIKPRKGQFVVFENINNEIAVDGDCSNTDDAKDDENIDSNLLPSVVIQPVPTEYTKGVIVWKSVYGNIIVGPTAEEQESRTDRSNDKKTIEKLTKFGMKIIPGLKNMKVIGSYSGIRTATEYRDYQIYSIPNMNWITVGGIRSTGLTAASGIAEYVFSLYDNNDVNNNSGNKDTSMAETIKIKNVVPPFLPSLPLSPKPKYVNPRIPSLSKLRANYNERGDGNVELFGQVWKVTHPLSIFGLKKRTKQQHVKQ